MQTSIEWFIEHLLGNGLLRLTKDDHNLYSKLRDEAKEMYNKEMVTNSNQSEIPDEDIKRGIKREYLYSNYNEKRLMIEGAMWYKERLKQDKW